LSRERGERAELRLVCSMRVRPEALQRAGYEFTFTDVETTLRDVLS